jgi:hypothetical protein
MFQKKHVIFLVDRKTVEAEPQVFVAGQVYELVEPSCDRWISRKAARYATPEEVKAAAKAAKKATGKAAEKVPSPEGEDQQPVLPIEAEGEAATTQQAGDEPVA